jgi:hypothetical protein
MPEVSSKPVKLPDNKHIALPEHLKVILQARSIIMFTGSLIVVDMSRLNT